MYLCDMLKEENGRLKQLVNSKENHIGILTSEIEELKTKYDNLKFAQSFASADMEEKEKAKRRLSKLVRDIDKCITMIKG